jgi:hypothetical protein
MNRLLPLIIAVAIPLSFGRAATPEQEKAFLDSYKKALEAADAKALAAFLHTEGAQAEQIEFFKMLQMPAPGTKVVSIELVTPSAADAAKFNTPMTMPDGKSYVMGLQPTKQLVVVTETKDGSGSSKGTSKSPVAEKNGKLVIPVPVPAKK